MADSIKISEKQLEDLAKALLTSDFVDVIQDALNNSNDPYDRDFYDTKSEFYSTIQSKLENALYKSFIIN